MFLINCYYTLHFRCFFHFSVMKLEFKRFGGTNFNYSSTQNDLQICRSFAKVNLQFEQGETVTSPIATESHSFT